jgi:hypothetical protein
LTKSNFSFLCHFLQPKKVEEEKYAIAAKHIAAAVAILPEESKFVAL